MPERFLDLSPEDKKDALAKSVSETGRPANLLEKDVWVVQALDILFSSEFAGHLVFKGGTALSKVYGVIDRFSEDIDITYDIRELAPQETAGTMREFDVIPASASQQKKISDLVRKERLPHWLETRILPLFSERLAHINNVSLTIDENTLFLRYPSVTTPSTYAPSVVRLEFGGRSTGEPAHAHRVVCDLASSLPMLEFPTATPRTMDLSRIFWEKATAVHVYCLQREHDLGNRFSRHLHDLARLGVMGYATSAINERSVAQTVADHKSLFFRMKAEDGSVIDYQAAVNGQLVLVPRGAALDALRADYDTMRTEGLLSIDAVSFDQILDACQMLQDQANGTVPSSL